MRPNEFYSEVTKAIEFKLKTGSSEKFIPYLIDLMERECADFQINENDYRTGAETYGYENVESQLSYISDRWNCAFRLRWLLDGINGGHI